MSESGLPTWGKISLISWKNWNVLWNHRRQTLISLLTPSFSTIILIILRFIVKVEQIGVVKFEPIDLEEQWKDTVSNLMLRRDMLSEKERDKTCSFLPKMVLAFAPNTAYYEVLMKTASSDYLSNFKIEGYKTNEDLRAAILKEHHFAGVNFYSDETSEYLQYALVFPSELRFYNDTFIGEDWNTNVLFDIRRRSEVICIDNDGCNLGYIREGFVSLQHAIAMSIIKTKLKNKNTKLPKVKIQRFPEREDGFDPLLDRIDLSLPLIILIGYLYPCINFTKSIVREKETYIDENLKLLGIGNKVLFFTWFIKGFTNIFLATIPVTMILKVHWSDGFGICNKSNWSALFFVLVSYGIASMSFCFLISSLTNRTLIAVIVVTFFWFFTYLPFMLAKLPHSFVQKMLLVIFSNTTMGFLFDAIVKLEKLDSGLQWYNMWRQVGADHTLTAGTSAIILIILSLVYTLISLYFEASTHKLYKMLKSWYRSLFKMSEPVGGTLTVKTSNTSRLGKTKIIEINHEYKKIGIEVVNISKRYYGTHILKNITFSAYEGDITVIMGHNGAGKTALLSIIAGLLLPSSGEVHIKDMALTKLAGAGFNMGVSLHHNILFPDLTVANQIIFYCRLKGLSGESLKAEVRRYLSAMDLDRMADVLTRELTVGLKCHLSVCCALCGNSKYVLLDEPSTGMDLAARKKLWDLLIAEKTNRTILLTTHSTYEAEVLADRIAILSSGELMCYGSSYFLNTIYGKGYRLECVKLEKCVTSKVTEFIRNYIPNITPASDIGTEISYTIKEIHLDIIPKLLQDLEEALADLNMSSCSISEPGVQDIFLRMGAEYPSEEDRVRHHEIMNGYTIYVEEYDNLSFLKNHETYKGFQLMINQLRAMLFKRLLISRSFAELTFVQLCVPGLVVYFTFIMSNPNFERQTLVPMTFRISQYQQSTTTLDDRSAMDMQQKANMDLFKKAYSDLCTAKGVMHKLETTDHQTFTEYILAKQEENGFSSKYLVGASYDRNDITAWFNNYPLHTAPLSLNMVHNGIMRELEIKGSIVVHHEPLPFTTEFDPKDVTHHDNLAEFLATNLSFTVGFVFAFALIYVVYERETRFKLLQYISGARPFTFFLANMCYEFLAIFTLSLFVLCVLISFKNDAIHHFDNAVSFFALLVLFGTCLVPVYYLLSFLFSDYVTGYAVVCILNANSVVLYNAISEAFRGRNPAERESITPYKLVFSVMPLYSLCECLAHILSSEASYEMCTNPDIRLMSEQVDKCIYLPNCCGMQTYFTWRHMKLYPQIIYVLVLGVASMILLLIIEYRKVYCGQCRVPRDSVRLAKKSFDKRFESEDNIIKEELQVRSLQPSQYRTKPLVMSNVSKVYGEKIAVNRISLLLERCECIGLLGINGSGKSTVIKMLAGDESMSCGRVYVEGISLTDDIFEMYKRISYCPQTDAAPYPLTCRQVLELVCHLRGIPRQHIPQIGECLAKVLGIISHYDKKLSKVSPGNRRRMSTAIALIGRPAIVYMDMYGAGIDAVGRRQLLNITWRMLKIGTAVVVSMISGPECERFCTRMGIIADGTLQCLDTVDNFTKRYIRNYTLLVKVRYKAKNESFNRTAESGESNENLSTSAQNPFFKVISFVEEQFPNATLKHQRGCILIFLIPVQNATLSLIFKKISRNAFYLNVDTFCVKRSAISIVFVDMAEKNKNLSRDFHSLT